MSAEHYPPDLLQDRLPLLVVDDDESVLKVTRLVLSRFHYDEHSLEILEAQSAAEARQILSRRSDIAVILLDVVMETDDAGLRLVEAIRTQLDNHNVRIILRTGQPGYAPQHEVIRDYDINDYLSKSDATQGRLFFSLTTALRNYHDIIKAQYLGRQVARADKASQAKTQFLAHMSHEIRTPLNGLAGTVQLLADTTLDDEQQQLLDNLKYTTEALMGIVNDVLDVSKIEAGKLELHPQPFELAELVNKVGAIFSANMQLKSVSFHTDLASGLPRFVQGDALRIQQILMNYLSNAFKFTAGGGTITLRLSPTVAGRIRFEVIDNGVGINADRLAHIFDAYEQENATIAGQFGGTGLGLSLCRSLAELMGGEVGVESHEGDGSCFWLELALADAGALDESKPAEVLSLSGKYLMLCEDDATSRKVLAHMLSKTGADVQAFDDGLPLLQHDFSLADVIILDCHMPLKDGFSTARELRSRGYQGPVIALTAAVTQQEIQQCLAAGMDQVLAKPVQAETLYQQLAELLNPAQN